MQTTLILQLDKQLVQYVEKYAKQQGKSVSQLVAEYFALLKTPNENSQEQLPPITQSLRGVLRGSNVDEQDYQQFLKEKYL